MARPSVLGVWTGPAVVAASLVAVDLATHGPFALPDPWSAGLFLLALGAVVFAAFVGTRTSAAIAVALYVLYTPRLTAEPGQAYATGPEALVSTAVVLFFAAPLAALTLWLNRRQQAANARTLAAEQEHGRVLLAANEALESFTYVVSHDVKEPLRAVDILLRALEEDEAARLSPEGRELLAQARRAHERLRGLTERLIEFSRAAHQDLAGLAPVPLAEALAHPDCASRYESLAKERDAEITFEGTDHAVQATHASLCQIFGNLILNGILHNPRERPRVRVSASPLGSSQVEVRVEDDGPGFPPEVLASFQGAGRLARGGFGLTIARRAVERLGGEIRLGNLPAGGARVVVLLPAARRGAAAGG